MSLLTYISSVFFGLFSSSDKGDNVITNKGPIDDFVFLTPIVTKEDKEAAGREERATKQALKAEKQEKNEKNEKELEDIMNNLLAKEKHKDKREKDQKKKQKNKNKKQAKKQVKK